jgi:aspartate/methionine/tyrosine aminotransferase
MEWAKLHARPRWNLAGSNLLPCTVDDLPGAREALELSGDNDNGYRPLVEAIAARYGVAPEMVATAPGASGANFLVYVALVEAGCDVLVERPGYDPLFGPMPLFGARLTRFDRRFEDGYRVDPEAVRRAITPKTRLIVITNLHNPTGVLADEAALEEVGRIAEGVGAKVLVDEVYLDSVPGPLRQPIGARSPVFITTSSLTKSYGLSGLRCGWVIASPEVAEKVRRARDVVDGSGAFPAERLSVLAFQQIDRLAERARRLLDRNRRLMLDFVATRPDLELVEPAGGTVVFPRLRGVADTAPFTKRLVEEYEVCITPGAFFQAPSHVLIGFGGDPQVLAEALPRLGRALDAAR